MRAFLYFDEISHFSRGKTTLRREYETNKTTLNVTRRAEIIHY